MSPQGPSIPRRTRLRFGALPKPPAAVEVPYAKRRDEFADFDEGEAVAWLISRPEWEQTIGAECDAVEDGRSVLGSKPWYTTRELEAVLFFQVMVGLRTYRAARNRLAGDRGKRARVALGFDQPCKTRSAGARVARWSALRGDYLSPPQAVPARASPRRLCRYFDQLRKHNARDPKLREVPAVEEPTRRDRVSAGKGNPVRSGGQLSRPVEDAPLRAGRKCTSSFLVLMGTPAGEAGRARARRA